MPLGKHCNLAAKTSMISIKIDHTVQITVESDFYRPLLIKQRKCLNYVD